MIENPTSQVASLKRELEILRTVGSGLEPLIGSRTRSEVWTRIEAENQDNMRPPLCMFPGLPDGARRKLERMQNAYYPAEAEMHPPFVSPVLSILDEKQVGNNLGAQVIDTHNNKFFGGVYTPDGAIAVGDLLNVDRALTIELKHTSKPIDGDDNKESETWDEVARCHRDMDTPRSSTSGHGFAYGKPTCRFPSATRLASTSAIGDALIGVRRWDEPGVIHERNIVLGSDKVKAEAYIEQTRSKLMLQYRIAYDIMVETEKLMFGPDSYFADREGATARAARQPASDYDSQSTSNAFSDDSDPAGDESE